MNRRDFIRSLLATCAVALVPWKLPQHTKAMGGPVPAGKLFIIGNGHRELLIPSGAILDSVKINYGHATWEFAPNWDDEEFAVDLSKAFTDKPHRYYDGEAVLVMRPEQWERFIEAGWARPEG